MKTTFKQQQQQTAIHNLKLPPYSLEAEQAVLGSVMIRPDAYAEIADIINEENFYSEKHKKIFINHLKKNETRIVYFQI